jgi:lysophospholipase L1-like esterase
VVKDRHRSATSGEADASVIFCRGNSSQGYILEGFIPHGLITIGLHHQMEMALQLYLNDADKEDDPDNFSLPWYSVRDSYRNPYALQSIRLAANEYPDRIPEIRACIVDGKTVHLKIISDRSYEGHPLRILSGSFQHRFRLNKEKMFTRHWNLPASKISPGGGSFVGLFLVDKPLQVLDLEMAHLVYEKTDPPEWYEDEIRIFQIRDKYRPPPDSAILFTGSSTIRRWHSLADDIGQNSINRGFGGSVMKELNLNMERIVFPYNPSMIFVYEGDNDIARGETPSGFLDECKIFIRLCQQRLPNTEIIFLSIKPSPSRLKYWKQMDRANGMLEDLCQAYEHVRFIDISTPMFSKPGVLKNDIFDPDELHLNVKGYSLLSQTIKDAMGASLH